jgi:hypothetical protein
MVKRFHDPGDWMQSPTGEYVLAADYDRLLDIMKDTLELATQFLRDRSDDGVMDEDDEGLLRQCETVLEWAEAEAHSTAPPLTLSPDGKQVGRWVQGFPDDSQPKPHSFDCPSLESGPCDCSASDGEVKP